MLIPSLTESIRFCKSSLSRRVNANSQPLKSGQPLQFKLIKKGEC